MITSMRVSIVSFLFFTFFQGSFRGVTRLGGSAWVCVVSVLPWCKQRCDARRYKSLACVVPGWPLPVWLYIGTWMPLSGLYGPALPLEAMVCEPHAACMCWERPWCPEERPWCPKERPWCPEERPWCPDEWPWCP